MQWKICSIVGGSFIVACSVLAACDDGASGVGGSPPDGGGGTVTRPTQDAASLGRDAAPDERDAGGDAAPKPLTSAELLGRWVSTTCEAYPDGQGGQNHLKRDFSIEAAEWNLSLVIYADAACTTPLFESRIKGPYTLGALSSVAGATEGEFGIATNAWTARTDAMATTFTNAGCGQNAWQVGVAQDVASTGCINVAHKIADCPKEYDVVSVRGKELFFGERITDMCKADGRPKKLNTYPVVQK